MKTYLSHSLSRWMPVRLVAAALLLASPLAAWGQATIVDIATDATDPSNLDDSEPSIAVNPMNPLEIAVVTFSETWSATRGAPVWKSSDGGATWRKVFQIPPPASGFGPGDQKIAYNGLGRLFIAELGTGDYIYRQLGGPDAPLTPGPRYGDDQPHLAVDASPVSPFFNRVYSPYLSFSSTLERSSMTVSQDEGVTLLSMGIGNNSQFPNRTTRIALAPDGTAYIIYKTREQVVDSNFQRSHFYVKRSDDGGGNWDALGTTGVSVHGVDPVITYFSTTFGNTAKGKVARARSSDAWIAIDPGSGDVYTAYVSKDASGFAQIYVAHSSDGGMTWTSSRVTDGTHHSAFPEIAVTDCGAVGVLYIDYDDSGARTLFRHRFALSYDSGATWADELLQVLNPDLTFNASNGFLWGDYEGLTALGDTFYGVFTGQSIGRTRVQMDPIFFTETVNCMGPVAGSFSRRSVASLLAPAPFTHTNLPRLATKFGP